MNICMKTLNQDSLGFPPGLANKFFKEFLNYEKFRYLSVVLYYDAALSFSGCGYTHCATAPSLFDVVD